jgi:2-C-methyl-D-erythritol 2,4-cyclodiphosphate synthase
MLRIGIGYDVHPLVEGRDLILGGVKIPFEKGLAGHSDADVVCHAVSDAILGAIAEGDIGKHFPDTDQKYRDISSLVLLEKVAAILNKRKGKVSNLDVTVIAEKPKLAPFTDKMRENLSRVSDVSLSAVSIKCSTNNGLGFVGQGQGMACIAIVMVETKE